MRPDEYQLNEEKSLSISYRTEETLNEIKTTMQRDHTTKIEIKKELGTFGGTGYQHRVRQTETR
jgi:hypothetical protein